MRFLAISILLPLAAGVAVAQSAPQAGGNQPDFARWHQQHEAEFAQVRKQRADDIAMLIGLRPDQRPGLDQLLASMEGPHREAGADDGDRQAPPAPNADFSAKLDWMSQHIDAKNIEAKQKIEVARRFYASLDAGQRQRFDALDRLRHSDPMMHRGHGMRGGHGPMGG
jgi:periplasmic protein CpxP/Spy